MVITVFGMKQDLTFTNHIPSPFLSRLLPSGERKRRRRQLGLTGFGLIPAAFFPPSPPNAAMPLVEMS